MKVVETKNDIFDILNLHIMEIKDFIHLAFFLEDLLHRKVELVTPESISPYIKPQILKEVEYVAQ
ncbi:MAG: hypothetical protein HZB80_04750 [Deltaproteobacteria bacterium]|nr:hypothetical protein [Deltaproteobacteria bacterium]